MRVAVVLASLSVAAGLILAFTYGSLIGPILIIGGVGALLVVALPDAIDLVARLLSGGKLRD
jgi:hypothetical protein